MIILKCYLCIYTMKQQTELIVQLVVGFLLLTKPSALLHIANTFIGRLVLILAVVGGAMKSTLTGLIIAMLFIVLSESAIEGMDASDSSVEKESDKLDEDYKYLLEFRKKHCVEKDGKTLFVDNNKNVVSLDKIKSMYPNINFDIDNDNCINPCDEKCDMVIQSYDEQMTTEEQLRPSTSKKTKVERKKDSVQAGSCS